MGLTPHFTQHDIEAEIDRRVQRIEDAIINRLAYLGEACVNNAIAMRGYTDRTGNLKSSTGFIVLADGNVIVENFETKAATADKGENTGKDFARSLGAKYRQGYALIVVAGMNYAAKVESTGRNVLSTAEHYAEKELPKLMRELKRNIATI